MQCWDWNVERLLSGLTDAAGVVALFDHVDGDAVVVHAGRCRVDAGVSGVGAAAPVVVDVLSGVARALAAAAREDKGGRSKICLCQPRGSASAETLKNTTRSSLLLRLWPRREITATLGSN